MEFEYRYIEMYQPHGDEEVTLINTCFEHWSQVFGEDLSSRGAILNKADFHRARLLAMLFYQGEMVGFHLYSVFDLRESPSIHHPYLITIPETTKKVLREGGSYSVMAMEYLTILPAFRSRELAGLKPGEIITRLGLRLMEELGLDVALGVARVDRKVNSMVLNIGYVQSETIEKFNNQCAIVYFDRHHHELKGEPRVLHFIDELWNQRNRQEYLKPPVAA